MTAADIALMPFRHNFYLSDFANCKELERNWRRPLRASIGPKLIGQVESLDQYSQPNDDAGYSLELGLGIISSLDC